MNPRYYLILLIIVILAGGGFFAYSKFSTKETETTPLENEEQVFCTQDAKQCEDGSFVSRIAPSCEFAKCPTGTATSSASTLDSTNQEENSILVRYNGKNFEPENIEIEKGQTVRFLNESTKPMWIGSDSHPTHSLYPEKSEKDCLGSSFDQCGTASQGESFEFKFDAVGIWGYHNHVAPSQNGTVTVK